MSTRYTLPPYGDAFAPLECTFDFANGTLADAIEWAVASSADDPDAEHPLYIRELLRGAMWPGWSRERTLMARDLPSIDEFVVAWRVAEVAEANRAAAETEPAQLCLVLGDATDGEADAAQVARLMLALSRAYAELGRVPTLRDVQRRRVGLPEPAEFDAVGGFRAAVRRFRAELAVVA